MREGSLVPSSGLLCEKPGPRIAMCKRAVLFLAGVILAIQPARAQIVAPAGRTLFNRGVMVRSLVRLDNFDEGVPGLSVRRVVNPNAVVWGAAPHLSVSFVVPVVSVDRDDPTGDDTTTGTGDGRIFARYDAIRKIVPAGYTRLSPEIGVKLPTGGAFGTGSSDFSGTLVFSHVRDAHWLVSDIQFTYNTEGDDDLRLGNRWRYDLAYLYRVFPRKSLGVPGVLLVVELNRESAARARSRGTGLPNTGGDVLFLSPGVEFFASRQLVLEVSVPIRIHEDLNGSQIRPSYSLIAGFRFLM